MKKITYKKLTIQNFLSVGNDTIEIDFQNGLNLITGSNIDNPERKNAVGKSALIEAFYYAVFGTTIRNIKKEFVINNVTKGSGKLELFFNVQTETGTSSYKVVRELKPSSVQLYKLGNKEEDISKDSISNTNKYICDLIGSNPTICKSCDILSLSDSIPFMGKKPEEKRKFIEDIFTLEVFGKMLKDLKEMIKENNSEMTISTTKLTEIVNNVANLKKQYEEIKTQIDKHEEIQNARKQELLDRIKSLEEQRDSLETWIEAPIIFENEKLNAAWEKMDGKIAKFTQSLKDKNDSKLLITANIKRLSNINDGNCPTCLQDVNEDHLHHIAEEISENNTQLKAVEDLITHYTTELNNVRAKKELVQAKLKENSDKLAHNKSVNEKIHAFNSKIDDIVEQLDNLNSDLDFKQSSLTSFQTLIDTEEKRQGEQEEQTKILKEKSEYLNLCKFILGEEGVKSFMIKRLLDMLNASIQKYINALGMTMRCRFDEYFDEQITNEKGKEISYWNFSGGERRTVDLACAWAFKDIKRKISGISSNVEFLDEVLDSAFDERGLDLLIEVIKDRIEKGGLSCYAISHRKETSKHIDGEIVNLEKENGITRRV